jgi:ribosome-binding ATPase YchF (GTP1/OBG family)
VVRCFEDADIHHVSGTVDPVRDIEVINTELLLADLDQIRQRTERVAKDAKRGDKEAQAELAVLTALETGLDTGKPALALGLSAEDTARVAHLCLLTSKPTIFACNVKDSDLATADQNPYVAQVRDYVRTHLSCEAVVISAQIESELIDLSRTTRTRFSRTWASPRAACSLIRATYHLLGSHLLHRGEGGARLDDSHRRHGPKGRRRHPHRLRARVHQGRNRRI